MMPPSMYGSTSASTTHNKSLYGRACFRPSYLYLEPRAVVKSTTGALNLVWWAIFSTSMPLGAVARDR